MLLLELVVHLRHIRNLALLKHIESRGQPEGRLSCPRWLVLRTSSIELLTFCGLFLIIFLLSGAWETLEGAILCALVTLRHAWWSAREPASAAGWRSVGRDRTEGLERCPAKGGSPKDFSVAPHAHGLHCHGARH